ncbi:MAG: hypothetical protein IKR85_09995 [Clostridia bacterium]|nr:hypothetical protein [Clostridia bacterium]
MSAAEAWAYFMGLCAAVAAVAKAAEILKKASGRGRINERLDALASAAAGDRARIKLLEEQNADRQKAQGVILRALIGIMEQLRTGGNAQALDASVQEINEFLTER